jgi:hypothetical protein
MIEIILLILVLLLLIGIGIFVRREVFKWRGRRGQLPTLNDAQDRVPCGRTGVVANGLPRDSWESGALELPGERHDRHGMAHGTSKFRAEWPFLLSFARNRAKSRARSADYTAASS